MVNEILAFLRCPNSDAPEVEGQEVEKTHAASTCSGNLPKGAPADAVYLDGTLGTGGHTLAMLQAHPTCRVIAFDRDERSMTVAKDRIERAGFAPRVTWVQGDYRYADELLEPYLEKQKVGTDGRELSRIDGALIDAGMSLWQIERATHGLSFRVDGPLDMRYDAGQAWSAFDLVNRLEAEALEDLIFSYTDERWARRIVQFIVAARHRSPISTTSELAGLIAAAIPEGARRQSRVHPATKTFAALRLAVNTEFWALDQGARALSSVLAPTARLVVLTYSSNEDRILKRTFRRLAGREIPLEAQRTPDRKKRKTAAFSEKRRPSGPARSSLSSSLDPLPPEILQQLQLPHQSQIRDDETEQRLLAAGWNRDWTMKIVTKKPVEPSDEEIEANPLSRSCKLRAIEKCEL